VTELRLKLFLRRNLYEDQEDSLPQSHPVGSLKFILAPNNVQISKNSRYQPYKRLIPPFSRQLDALSANTKPKRQLYFREPSRVENG
jgi:hypothetical protein